MRGRGRVPSLNCPESRCFGERRSGRKGEGSPQSSGAEQSKPRRVCPLQHARVPYSVRNWSGTAEVNAFVSYGGQGRFLLGGNELPKMDWDALADESKQKLGTYAEYFAKMELASYGMDVYTSEVDDHGIDFVCLSDNKLLKVQVKSIRPSKTGYVFMGAEYFNIEDEDLYLFLLLFEQGKLPEPYLIPASAWKKETPLLRFHPYDKPEYGVNISKKNRELLEQFRLEKTLNKIHFK